MSFMYSSNSVLTFKVNKMGPDLFAQPYTDSHVSYLPHVL